MEFDEVARSMVSAAVRRRREQLGLSQEEAAARSGGLISTANLRVVEANGRRSLRPRSVLGLARALDWPDDALERIAAGDDPGSWRGTIAAGEHRAVVTPRAAGVDLATSDQVDVLRRELAEQRRTIADLAERVDALAEMVAERQTARR